MAKGKAFVQRAVAPMPCLPTTVRKCTAPSQVAPSIVLCTIAGKREASIQGAGVGGKSAAKLLARYGSLEAVLAAAEAGELKGWGPAVARLLQGGSSQSSGGSKGRASSETDAWQQRKAQLRRNRRLFAANTEPSVVESGGWGQLLAALDRLQPAATSPWECSVHGRAPCVTGPGGSAIIADAGLAWQHPLLARRQQQLQQLLGSARPGLAVTPEGLAVDELCSRDSISSISSSRSRAVFHVCPCDVEAGSWAAAVAAAGDQAPGTDSTAALMPLLHGAMRHHIKLLQRAGYQVQLKLAADGVLPAGLLTG